MPDEAFEVVTFTRRAPRTNPRIRVMLIVACQNESQFIVLNRPCASPSAGQDHPPRGASRPFPVAVTPDAR